MLKDVILPDGTRTAIDEWLHDPRYSTCEIAPQDNLDLRLFSYSRGQQVPRTASIPARLSNDADTNMVLGNQMGYDEAFIVYAMTFEAFTLRNADGDPPLAIDYPHLPLIPAFQSNENPAPLMDALTLRAAQRNIVVELLVGASQRKPRIRETFGRLGQSVGAHTIGVVFNNFPQPLNPPGTAGEVEVQNQRRYEEPIYIREQEVARVRLYAPDGSVGAGFGPAAALMVPFRLRMYLDGLRRRPV